MLEEHFLDFALLYGCDAIYDKSSDGISISSVLDAFVEQFCVIISIH